jgi:hypothetical protein
MYGGGREHVSHRRLSLHCELMGQGLGAKATPSSCNPTPAVSGTADADDAMLTADVC